MTESFSKEQDADLLFYQNGLLKKEIERLRDLAAEKDKEILKWKTEAEVQNFGLSMAKQDRETKDAEIERLQSIARMAYQLVDCLYEFPDDPSCCGGCNLAALNRSLEAWKEGTTHD
jgi:hypothetical protein